jgi:hypothetical protein
MFVVTYVGNKVGDFGENCQNVVRKKFGSVNINISSGTAS